MIDEEYVSNTVTQGPTFIIEDQDQAHSRNVTYSNCPLTANQEKP